MTPAGTSNELDVQNEWEENTHTMVSWVWEKRGSHYLVHGDAKAAFVRNYLEVYWPYGGGLSAVKAIDTQMRDPINSGLTR